MTKKFDEFYFADRPPRILRMGDQIDDRKRREWERQLMAARANAYFESQGMAVESMHNFPESYRESYFEMPNDENISREEDLL